VEITILVGYVDRKEDQLIQVVRTHQHDTDSAVLQTARCLKTSTERNKKNEGEHSGENERKMALEMDAWAIAT
jgi:hypothetical protein